MIRISQLKLPITHTREQLYERAAKTLRIPAEALKSLTVVKRSVDARKKEQILFIYTLDAEVAGKDEKTVIRRAKNAAVTAAVREEYHFPKPGDGTLSHPPVIVGSGPAGLFAGSILGAVDHLLRMLDPQSDGEGFGLHRDPALVKR